MSLAAKLPWTHRFAGGFSGIGSQPLPTDADAIDYLTRMATADGAGVEVSVATAVDAFVRDSKALGVWDSIRASCVLAGARTLAGALVPLRDYGPELVDIDNLPTPTINNASGSSGAWDADSLTMSSTSVSSDASYPRFAFAVPLVVGASYSVSGVLSGDVNSVGYIRLASSGSLTDIAINGETGAFSGTSVTASAAQIQFLLNGTLAPTSVTIESLSIREVIASPTNVANGFVSGDYSRTSGLKGDGTSYIDSGRANDDDPQNDKHIAVYKTANATQNGGLIGTVATTEGASWLFDSAAASGDSIRVNEEPSIGGFDFGANTFVGASRSSPSSCDYRVNGTSGSASTDSGPPAVDSVYVFRAALSQVTNATLAFYSIGTSLSLEDLDTSVSNLITAIGNAL